MAEKTITIDLIINNDPEQKDIIFYRINNNNTYSGTFIGPGGNPGDFTTKLNNFFQDPNNSEFYEFLTFYQANNQAKSSSWKFSNFFKSNPSKKVFPSPNDYSPSPSPPSPKPNNTKGGKKTKSNRSYNANKTLKNRK